MKRLFAFLSLLAVALSAAPFEENVFFPPAKMPDEGFYPGMRCRFLSREAHENRRADGGHTALRALIAYGQWLMVFAFSFRL